MGNVLPFPKVESQRQPDAEVLELSTERIQTINESLARAESVVRTIFPDIMSAMQTEETSDARAA